MGAFDDLVGAASRLVLAADRSSLLEETTVCRLAESSLRLAYPGVTPSVTPAPERPDGAVGVLDVLLTWRDRTAPPLGVRVVVHDEIARAAWREVSAAIGDAVRAALARRCPAHPHPHRRDPHE